MCAEYGAGRMCWAPKSLFLLLLCERGPNYVCTFTKHQVQGKSNLFQSALTFHFAAFEMALGKWKIKGKQPVKQLKGTAFGTQLINVSFQTRTQALTENQEKEATESLCPVYTEGVASPVTYSRLQIVARGSDGCLDSEWIYHPDTLSCPPLQKKAVTDKGRGCPMPALLLWLLTGFHANSFCRPEMYFLAWVIVTSGRCQGDEQGVLWVRLWGFSWKARTLT